MTQDEFNKESFKCMKSSITAIDELSDTIEKLIGMINDLCDVIQDMEMNND